MARKAALEVRAFVREPSSRIVLECSLTQKGRPIPVFRSSSQCLKSANEAGLAVMRSAHPAHGFLPFGRQARPLIAVSGALEIGQRGVVVFALLGVDQRWRVFGEAIVNALRLMPDNSRRKTTN